MFPEYEDYLKYQNIPYAITYSKFPGRGPSPRLSKYKVWPLAARQRRLLSRQDVYAQDERCLQL
jgi:hypothetical protein